MKLCFARARRHIRNWTQMKWKKCASYYTKLVCGEFWLKAPFKRTQSNEQSHIQTQKRNAFSIRTFVRSREKHFFFRPCCCFVLRDSEYPFHWCASELGHGNVASNNILGSGFSLFFFRFSLLCVFIENIFSASLNRIAGIPYDRPRRREHKKNIKSGNSRD